MLLLILLQPLFALGNADLLPAITPTTINGVWESSLEKAGGVWRMDVNTNGDSYLASVGAPNGFYHSIYRLRSWNIKNGDLRLRFSNISDKTDATKQLIIEGKGVAGSESGVIEAKITFKTNFPTPNPITQIPLSKEAGFRRWVRYPNRRRTSSPKKRTRNSRAAMDLLDEPAKPGGVRRRGDGDVAAQ